MESLEVIFRSLWHALITFEVLASTVIHCTYGATILIYTLLTDAFLRLAAVSIGNVPGEPWSCQEVHGQGHEHSSKLKSIPVSLRDTCCPQEADHLPSTIKHALSEGALDKRNHRPGESGVKAPIVLLHGIFGFGHGVCRSHTYVVQQATLMAYVEDPPDGHLLLCQ